jgi:hypothetical protein
MAKVNNNTFLAVAFTDNNGNHIFDKGDTLIAGINDKDKSGTVSVGDTVTFDSYPLHIDGTGRGSFKDHTETITAVEVSKEDNIIVDTSAGNINWHTATSTSADAEIFRTEGTTSPAGVELADSFPNSIGQPDDVDAEAHQGAGAPTTNAFDSGLVPGNQPFFDVFIA